MRAAAAKLMYDLSRLIPGSRGRALRRHYRDRAWLTDADDAFVSFPKSGRTFVRAMLAHLYEQQFGIDARELLEFPALKRAKVRVPRVLFTHDQDAMRKPAQIRIKERAYRSAKLIFLARHPADVVISRYHHLQHRSRDAARKRLSKQPLDRFVWTEQGGIPSIVAFMNAWAALSRRRDDFLLVRYEDVLSAPAKELRRIADFIGLQSTDQQVDDAVAFARIDNLKAKEREGYFTSDRLRERDSSDPLSGKVRSGKAGGYRASLSAENVSLIDAFLAEQLDPIFGYTVH